MFLNSSICLLSKAAKFTAPALLLLLELSLWVVPGLLVSGAAVGLGLDAAGFSGVLYVK